MTAGIAMVGGGQGKSLLLPAVSGEGQESQGLFAEGFFAKSVDELMGDSHGMMTQVSAEQTVTGADKKDVQVAKDLSEAGTQVSDAGLSCAVATNLAVTFGGEGLQGTQTTGATGQPVKEASAAVQLPGDLAKTVVAKTPIEDSDELKGSAAVVVEPQQSPLVLRAPLIGTVAPQVVDPALVVSKEAVNSEKLQATGVNAAETKRETKKKGNESPADGDAKIAVVSVDTSALPSTIAIATSSPVTVLPASADVPVVPKVEAGVASAKSSRVGSVGYKASANVAGGIVATDGKGDVERGKETVASVSTASSAGVHSAGHSQSAEIEASMKNALSQGVGAVIAVAPVVAVDGSTGAQGVMQKQSSALGNVSAAITRSQEAAVGDAAPVYDGHSMVSVTPTSLEVGVANGSHGWLKIRAELTDGGAVNASVSAASSAGQEMLHRELPSLTAYLQSERLGVNTVVVHAAAATTEAKDFSGAMSGDQREPTQQEGSSQSGDARQGLTATASDLVDETVSFTGLEGADASALSSAMYGEGGSGGGGWLSVRA